MSGHMSSGGQRITFSSVPTVWILGLSSSGLGQMPYPLSTMGLIL